MEGACHVYVVHVMSSNVFVVVDVLSEMLLKSCLGSIAERVKNAPSLIFMA